MELTRRNRSSIDPVPGRRSIVIDPPSARDKRIFRLLDPRFGYRFLPTNLIHHFIGGDKTFLVKRLGHLKERQNAYLYWPDQQDYSQNAKYKHGVYALTPKGARAINTTLPPLPKQEYAHELLRCIVEASFVIGAKEAGLRHIGWNELSVHPFVPAATRSAEHPFKIALRDGHMQADGPPIVLAMETAQTQRRIYLPCKEIDRDTEGLERTIATKLRNYLEFVKRKLFQSHFGFEHALIPFVTTTEARMRGIMTLAESIIGAPCPWLLFKTVPDYALAANFPDPNGAMVTEPWLRVGHKPFSLATFSEVA